uniref:PNK FHA domain-containing protein n=1 Tax=Gasterosteus aculeatus aculeatus TaxID=481459 RepID=G3Q7Z1_GASAC
MSGFDLVRVDAGGGGPIRLPPGETVLGRGPLLGVSDKRVSRLHGLLENLDGELRLKPTHLNPCFVQASPTDDPRPLQRNSWHQLRHGDLFSLLPGRLIFQVEAVGGEGRTPRNGRLFVEGGLPLDPEPDVESPPSPAQEKEEEEEEAAGRSSDERDSERPNKVQRRGGGGDAPPSVSRRRVLPAWMTAAVAAPSSSSSPKGAGRSPFHGVIGCCFFGRVCTSHHASHACLCVATVKRSRGPPTSTQPAAAKKAPPTTASSPGEAELSEEEMPRKRRRNMSDEEEESARSKT